MKDLVFGVFVSVTGLVLASGCGDEGTTGGGGPEGDAAVGPGDGSTGGDGARRDAAGPSRDGGGPLDASTSDGSSGGGDASSGSGVRIVTPDPLPDGIAGQDYTIAFAATGGDGNYQWTGVNLPFGSLDAGGAFSGVPPASGAYTLTIRVESAGESDTRDFHLQVYDPLVTTLPNPPLLQGRDGLDVSQVVQGGKGSLRCFIYQGPGEGTVPPGVTQDPNDTSGCTLSGTVSASAKPGSYGFIVVVTDDLGQSIEVPVWYQGAPCNVAGVALTPPASPPQVVPAGSAYSWQLEVTNLNYPCEDPGCTSCRACINMFLMSGPLDPTAQLQCSNPGVVCSDCGPGCITNASTCPGLGSMRRSVDVRAHPPIRQGFAWETVELTLDYTGDDLQNCGPNHWECHIETLEQ